MTRFKVLGGNHTEDGKTYSKGDVFESDLDLIEMFQNKFKETTEAVTKPEPKKVMKAKRDDSDDEDLVVKDHQDRVNKEAPEYNQRLERDRYQMNLAKQKLDDDDSDDDDDDSDFGDDVSDKYLSAKNAGLRVHKKGSKYFVIDPENESSPVSGKKGLTKEKIKGFVKKYTAK